MWRPSSEVYRRHECPVQPAAPSSPPCSRSRSRRSGAGTASADPGDIGIEGPSYGDLGGSATGTKPESKLWFNDGMWWASMHTAGRHSIHRLDRSTGTWSDTGTVLDTRKTSRDDVLWHAASGKLYVASHPTTSGSAAWSGQAGRLWRYAYNALTKTYSLDAGFPGRRLGTLSLSAVLR